MSLVLALRAGQDVFVGDKRVVVSWVDTPFKFGLRLEDGSMATVTDTDWTQIQKGVKVQAGIPRNQDSTSVVRLQFDAPGVTIVRGALYRKASNTHCNSCGGTGLLKEKVSCEKCGGFGCSACNAGSITRSFKCPDCEEVKQ